MPHALFVLSTNPTGYLKKIMYKIFSKSSKGKQQNSLVVIKYSKMSKNVRNLTSTKIKSEI